MTNEDTNLGKIEVAPSAIAALVSEAVKECYGVVGMSSRGLLDDIAGSLQRGNRRGCLPSIPDDGAEVKTEGADGRRASQGLTRSRPTKVPPLRVVRILIRAAKRTPVASSPSARRNCTGNPTA